MLAPKLTLKSEGSLLRYRLGPLPRVLNGAVAAVFLAVYFVPGCASWIPLALAALAALLALYREGWEFDAAKGEVRYYAGLPFLGSRKRFPAAECRCVRLGEAGRPGATRPSYEHRLTLEGSFGVLLMDMGRGNRSLKHFEEAGQRLAMSFSLPFERP